VTNPSTSAFRVPLAGKRTFDLVMAVALLIVLALPLALIAILVAADLRGTPLFCQRRTGWKGAPFTIYKFRTMRKGSPPAGAAGSSEVPFLYVPRHDPRITRLGGFLRRYRIDETPQLLNVLVGDMSLIGPRPFDIGEFEQGPFPYPRYDEWVRMRHWTRPGITGLWQVSGGNDTSFSELIALDLQYVLDWTLAAEFSILRRTFNTVMGGGSVD